MEQNAVLGMGSAVVSVLAFGTTYVPVRWFECGDGVYFQWLMCIGQLIVGTIVYLADGCPQFFPLAMLGGAFFALGNSLTMFIMDGIGMAVGSLLWNTVVCLVGWAVSRFGLFGTPATVPFHNALNIFGVVVVCIGGCFFAPLKHHPMKVRPGPPQFYEVEENYKKEDEAEHNHKQSKTRRIIALLLTIVVGLMHGNMLTPINYVIAEQGGTPFIHSHFFAHSIGSVLTSTFVFLVYALIKKNRPFVNPEISVPSMLAGIIYGIATCTMFIANQHLGQVIAYPIIAKSPGIVTSLWAVLLFKEIRGRLNLCVLVCGILVTLTGVTLISLSKIDF